MTFKPTFGNVSEANDISNNKPEYTSDKILVIDMDEVLYEIAAACEQRGITVTNKSNEASSTFKTRTEFKDLLKGLEVPDDFFDIQDTQIAEPIGNAIVSMKGKLNNFRKKFDTDKLEFYLSGKNNFRLDLPLPIQYKSARKSALRPLLLADLREYAIKYLKAVVIEGDEADQMIAQRMWDGHKSGKDIIAISEDKDARSNIGMLYNPAKDELLTISGFGELYLNDKRKAKGYGRVWLYYQILMGDWSTDTFCPRQVVKAITGKLPAFGDVACVKYLENCKTDQEAWQAINAKYVEWFGTEPFEYTAWNGEKFSGDYLDVMQMITDCARMKRWDGDDVQVRNVLKKMRIIE
jgi:hypothetical protein